MATQTVTQPPCVQQHRKAQEPVVIVLKSPEEPKAQGSWLNTALGVALVGGALYGAYQYGLLDSVFDAKEMGIPSAQGITDTVKSYFWSGVGHTAAGVGAIYVTKETAQAAGPKVADALVATGGKVASKSAQYFPTLVGLAVDGLNKVGGIGFRFVTSLLPFGNRGLQQSVR